MSELEKKVEKLADEELNEVAGGVSANYLAALDVMAGKYGNDQYRVNALRAAGYDARLVQDLVNEILK